MPVLLKTLIVIEILMAVGLGLFRFFLSYRHRDTVSPTVVTLALITPPVALFCGNLYVFCAYLALIVAVNARSRAQLAANFVFLLPLMPALSQETAVGGVYLLAISAVLAMSFGALIGFIVTSGRTSHARIRTDVSMLLLIGIFVFIYNRDASFTGLLRSVTGGILGFVGPYLLISRGVSTRPDLERLLLRLSLGAFLTALVGLFQASKHWLLFQSYYDALHVSIPFGTATLAMRAGLLRTGGAMLDYSAAGVFFASVLCVMPMLKPLFRPLGFWAVLAVLIGGLLATQSRGAWIAAAVGFLFVLAFRRQWGKAALLLAAGIATELAALLLGKSGVLAGIVGGTAETAGTVSYRKLLAERGFDQIRAHPLLGQSPTQLVENLPDLVQGQHIVDFVNSHLYIAMTAGVPLFLVWCYVWLAPVFEAWRHPSRGRIGSDLVEVPVAIITPVMIAITATSIIDRNLYWPIIAVALAGPCFALARRESGIERKQRSPLVHAVGPAPRAATALA